MRFFTTAFVLLSMGFATPVLARDVALVIDQGDYRSLTDLPRDSRISAMADQLESDGFEVTRLANATLGELRAAAFSTQSAAQADAERVVIIVRGHIVADGQTNWLLAQEARTPDRFDIGSKALPLALFDSALTSIAGRSLLVLIDNPRALSNLSDLAPTAANNPAPQGVTHLRGDSRAVQSALTKLLAQGATTAEVAQGSSNATLSGFISRAVAFSASPTTSTPIEPPSQDIGEIAYWSAVRDIGTPEALQAYINRYPNGLFTADARSQITARVQDRETRLKEAEAALALNRDKRRSIQRDLSLLGYNPRGIDGVFGPATRRAVSAWQADQNLEPHGYLDRDQLALMQEFALRRAAELEEEARRRRAIEDARDRAFWQETGARNTEPGYRSYLKEFPDGVFASLARERLDEIEAERRAEMDARERNAWDIASDANTIGSYQQFLADFPNGVFAEAAQSRIAELNNEETEEDARRKYLGTENAVAGNGAARLLIESRLSNLGLKPGKVDGDFTRDTRRALRRFQKARNLTVTGYVDQATMVQLLLGR